MTIVDTICANQDLNFEEPIHSSALFDAVCDFYPSPNRPGNDISDQETLESALTNAKNSAISAPSDEHVYRIPAPSTTSFHADPRGRFWTMYRQVLATRANTPVPNPPERGTPFLNTDLTQSDTYTTSRDHANRAAASVMAPRADRVTSVQPPADPMGFESLSKDELTFLTRVGLAMERQIKSYSLTESMSSFTKTQDGKKLHIDLDKLEDEDYLIRHSTRRTYYSVPWSVRRRLSIENISHDGWGERGPSEKTIHRTGVDSLASLFASQPGIDRVVRYADLWRFQNTAIWPNLQHLKDTRIDVVAFSESGEPRFVGEVETDSGDKHGTRDAVAKLQAFPDCHRVFAAPTGEQLSVLISRLSNWGPFESYTPPSSTRPIKIRDSLKSNDLLGAAFDRVLTYEDIRSKLPDDPATGPIVGSI